MAGTSWPVAGRPILDWDPFLWWLWNVPSTGSYHSLHVAADAISSVSVWIRSHRFWFRSRHWHLFWESLEDLWCWLKLLCLLGFHFCFSLFLFTWFQWERWAIRAHCSGVRGWVRQVGPRSPSYDVTFARTGPGHVNASQWEACDQSCSRNDLVFRTGTERKRLRFRVASCVALKLFCVATAFKANRCSKDPMNSCTRYSKWQFSSQP